LEQSAAVCSLALVPAGRYEFGFLLSSSTFKSKHGSGCPGGGNSIFPTIGNTQSLCVILDNCFKTLRRNMYTKIYWIHEFDNSARGEEWLEDEIVKFKKQNVGLLVSLLEQKEVSELGLYKQKELCLKHNIDFINFPIVDRGIPVKSDELNTFINRLTKKVREGLSVVIHCRMGIGRSSIIAASILLQAGLKTDDIIKKITKVRGLKVPDTDEQLK